MSFKELFTAYYDPNTDTINGCKEGGLIYLHELRHSQQYKNKWGKRWSILETYLIRIIGGMFTALVIMDWQKRLYYFAGAGMTLFFPNLMVFIWEIDAWIYAFREYKKR